MIAKPLRWRLIRGHPAQVRRKLWGALAELPIQQASLDSSCWSSNNGHRAPATTSSTTDMGALMLALTRWTSLRVLSLHACVLASPAVIVIAQVLPLIYLPATI